MYSFAEYKELMNSLDKFIRESPDPTLSAKIIIGHILDYLTLDNAGAVVSEIVSDFIKAALQEQIIGDLNNALVYFERTGDQS